MIKRMNGNACSRENLRQYCGLTPRRIELNAKGTRKDNGAITAQALYRAITAHAAKGGK